MQRKNRLTLRGCPALAIACAAVAAGACREEDGLRVADLEFEGVEAVDASALKDLLATRESGHLPWSRPRYFDRAAFLADLERVRQFYRDNGYPDARVTKFDATLQGDDAVKLVVTLDEGEPVVVEDVRLVGFEVIPADHRERLQATLPLRAGAVERRADVAGSRDMAARELHDHGFAYATVEASAETGSRIGRTLWTIAAHPGPKSYFGAIEVNGNVNVGDTVIRRELTFQPGDLFTLSDLHESQRRLYSLDLFQYANIEPRLSESGVPEIPVRITVAEEKPRQFSGSIGYGTEEKVRAEGGWQHRNFFGGARTARVDAKWSSLDRGVRVNFAQPFFLGVRQTLGVTAQRWFYDEPAYRLDTSGGRLTLNRARSRRDPVVGRGVDTLVSGSLIYEYEQYRVSNEALADLSVRDELIALGLDPRTGRGNGVLTALALDLRRDTTTNLLNARHGYLVAAHLEQAGWWLPGDFEYVELSGEGRLYTQVGPRAIWANRARIGSLEGRGSNEQVPFFKRYFLGGASSLRGWGRYDVAPLSGSGLPLGGHSFVEMSTELRVAAFGKIGVVGFLDAGNVWSGSWDFDLADLRYAVGPGLRYDTPIGPVRFDAGFQLTPIDGLLVDGKPERRHWRLHFSIGQTF
jgi:outer membrane protein assembly complex protein YaeT